MLRKSLLFLFLLIQFFSLNRELFIHFYSDSVMPLFTYSSYGALFLLPIILFLYAGKDGYLKTFTNTGIYIFAFLVLFFASNSIFGIITGNVIEFWVNDFSTYVTFACFILLGSKETFWEDFYGPAFYLFMFSILVNLYATTIIVVPKMELTDFTDVKERITRSFLSYETQKSLSFWAFFLLISPKANKNHYPIIIGGVLVMLLLQVLFQKRGPTLRVLLFIMTYLFIIPRLLKDKESYKVSFSKKFRLSLLIGVSIGILASVIPVRLVTNQLFGLIDRYSGKVGVEEGGGKIIQYEKGFLGIFTVENERIREVFIMLKDLNSLNVLIGKGAGGVYKDRSMFYAKEKIESLQGHFKNSTHIGLFTIVLKGGFIMLFLYLLSITYGLSMFKYHFYDVVSAASFFIILYITTFQLIEGWFLYSSNAFDCIVFSSALGRLITNKKRIKALELAS